MTTQSYKNKCYVSATENNHSDFPENTPQFESNIAKGEDSKSDNFIYSYHEISRNFLRLISYLHRKLRNYPSPKTSTLYFIRQLCLQNLTVLQEKDKKSSCKEQFPYRKY